MTQLTIAAFFALLVPALSALNGVIDATKYPVAGKLIALLLTIAKVFQGGLSANANANANANASVGAAGPGTAHAPAHGAVMVSSLPADHSPEALLAWAATDPRVMVAQPPQS